MPLRLFHIGTIWTVFCYTDYSLAYWIKVTRYTRRMIQLINFNSVNQFKDIHLRLIMLIILRINRGIKTKVNQPGTKSKIPLPLGNFTNSRCNRRERKKLFSRSHCRVILRRSSDYLGVRFTSAGFPRRDARATCRKWLTRPCMDLYLLFTLCPPSSDKL